MEIEVIPGVTAALSGAAVLGAPLGHDFAVISLSDLLTPWETIEVRLEAAAKANLCMAIYNPASHRRPDHLRRACEILLRHLSPETVCGVARNIAREGETKRILTLAELRDHAADMFTTVFVGNRETRAIDGRMVTPRGVSGCVRSACSPERRKGGGWWNGYATVASRWSPVPPRNMAASYWRASRTCAFTLGAWTRRRWRRFLRGRGLRWSWTPPIRMRDRATENIRRACEQGKMEYLRLSRGSDAALGDGVFVPDVAACVAFLRETEGPVLLTTGSKELPAFCADETLRGRIYARVLPVPGSLEVCASCGLTPERIFAMQGPFGEEMNLAMLRAAHARFLVTKDTGDAGGYAAKIRAAERAGVQAVIIGRPPQVDGISLEEAVRALEAKFFLADEPKRVLLIGMGMGDADSRTLAAERALREADCLIGSRRMLESVDGAGKIVREAIAAEDIARVIREESARRFAVLLSGDPGFYSGAKRLLGALKSTTVEVLPGIGSLQYFCAKLCIPWENVYCLSLHGRDGDIAGAVRTHEATFALLGGNGGARQALERLCTVGMGRLRAAIGECLAAANEHIVRGSVQELASKEYDALSVLLVENPHAGSAL